MHEGILKGLSWKLGHGAELDVYGIFRFWYNLHLFDYRIIWYLLCTSYSVLLLPKEAKQGHVVHDTSLHRVLPFIAIFSKMQKHPMCSGVPAHHLELIPLPSHSHFMTKTTLSSHNKQHKTQPAHKYKKLSDF